MAFISFICDNCSSNSFAVNKELINEHIIHMFERECGDTRYLFADKEHIYCKLRDSDLYYEVSFVDY